MVNCIDETPFRRRLVVFACLISEDDGDIGMKNNGNTIRTCKDKATTPDEFGEEESKNSTRNTERCPENNVALDKTKIMLFHCEIQRLQP